MMSRALVLIASASIAIQLSAQSFTLVPNLVYGTYPTAGGSQSLLLDLYLPTSGSSSHPLVVWIHGGGWSSGSRFPAPSHATGLCALGYAVASIDYRLTGVAAWPAQIQDCRGAIRWLRANAPTYGIDPERFGVWGSSAGGHLAALVATSGGVSTATIGSVTVDLEGAIGGNLGQSSRVQALCDWFGPTDFLAMRDFPTFDHDAPTSPESNLLGAAIQTVPEKAASANPITFLSPDDPPMLILHGTIDTTVPFNQSELLHAAALRRAGVGSTFFPVPGNGHGGPGFMTPAALALIHGYFDGLLLNAPPIRVGVVATDAAGSEAGDPASFDVTRTGSLAAPLPVWLGWSGTAGRAADYAAPALLAVIPAGAATVTIQVAPVQDAFVEGSETVELALCPSPDYRIDPAQATAVAILSDDESVAGLSLVSVTTSDASASEPGANTAAFLFTRTAPLAAPLSVQYTVMGTSRNGVDCALLSGTVSFTANVASAVVAVAPLDDPMIEPSETVIVTIGASASYAIGTPSTASAFIADDDKIPALPTVSVLLTDHVASELGPDVGSFAISRTLGTAVVLNVNVAIGGTASQGVDFAAIPAVVAIPAGQAWGSVPVTPLVDGAIEGEESVVLTVLPGPGYQIASAPSRALVLADADVPAIPATPLRLAATPIALGTLGTISLAGQPGQSFAIAVSPLPGFLDLSPIGHVLIDLGSATLLGTGTLDAAGIGSVFAPIPVVPSLLGFEVRIQGYAADANGGALSDAATREVFGP